MNLENVVKGKEKKVDFFVFDGSYYNLFLSFHTLLFFSCELYGMQQIE